MVKVQYRPEVKRAVIPFDSPDPDLTALARLVNAKAKSGKVSFFAKGGDVSVVFEAGPRRHVIALDGRPTDGDIEALVAALESWSGFQGDESVYSTEMPSPPRVGLVAIDA